MTLHTWIIYLTLVLVASATPGPAVVFAITNSALHGWKKAIFAPLGNIVGLLTLGIVSVTGLGAILSASKILFDIIKYIGAAYLMFLGLKMLFNKGFNFDLINSNLNLNGGSSYKIFLKALGVAISNPKAIIFLTALFPQFINANYEILPQFLLLICTLMFFSFFVLTSYVLLAHRTKRFLTTPKRVKLFNRTGGVVFIGFGILLAASRK